MLIAEEKYQTANSSCSTELLNGNITNSPITDAALVLTATDNLKDDYRSQASNNELKRRCLPAYYPKSKLEIESQSKTVPKSPLHRSCTSIDISSCLSFPTAPKYGLPLTKTPTIELSQYADNNNSAASFQYHNEIRPNNQNNLSRDTISQVNDRFATQPRHHEQHASLQFPLNYYYSHGCGDANSKLKSASTMSTLLMGSQTTLVSPEHHIGNKKSHYFDSQISLCSSNQCCQHCQHCQLNADVARKVTHRYSSPNAGFSTGQHSMPADDSSAGLTWKRLHMSRAKLKATATTSELLSGFAMVAMVELQINDPTNVPEWLFIMFSVCTTVLVAVHIFALMISTYLLPNIDAISKMQSTKLAEESPHERMKCFVEVAWAFSTVLGLFLFLVEVSILCWVKFWDFSIRAAMAATIIVIPVLIVFLAFVFYFYRSLMFYKFESSATDMNELEEMRKKLDHVSPA